MGKSWLPVLSSDHWITPKGNLFNHPMSVQYQPEACKRCFVFQGLCFSCCEKYLLFLNTPSVCAVLVFKLGTFRSLTAPVWALEGADGDFLQYCIILLGSPEVFLALNFQIPWFLSPDFYWHLQPLADSKLGRKCPETESTHQHILRTE